MSLFVIELLLAGFFLLVTNPPVRAQSTSSSSFTDTIYAGYGINQNFLPGGNDGDGVQFLGGVRIPYSPVDIGMTPYFEVGHQTVEETGDRQIEGVWYSGVAQFELNRSLDGLFRLGYDAGDDEGFLWGTGGEYKFDRAWALRAEYVERETLFSIQLNAVYRPF